MKVAANTVTRTNGTNGAARPKSTKKTSDSGVVPIAQPPLEATQAPSNAVAWYNRPDEPSKHTFEAETPAIRARHFVNQALDDMDRLVGTIIGIIDDVDYQPSDGDRERVRRAAAWMRSRLSAASGEMSNVVAAELADRVRAS